MADDRIDRDNLRLDDAVVKFEQTLRRLQSFARGQAAKNASLVNLESEIQSLNLERSAMADKLDAASARNQDLEDAHEKISKRLEDALSRLQVVLEIPDESVSPTEKKMPDSD